MDDKELYEKTKKYNKELLAKLALLILQDKRYKEGREDKYICYFDDTEPYEVRDVFYVQKNNRYVYYIPWRDNFIYKKLIWKPMDE